MWPKVESSSSVSQKTLQLLTVSLLLDCLLGCLHRWQGRRVLQTTIAWNTSAIVGSLSFSRSNRMRGLFVKRSVFSFNLMVASTRSWSLPKSAPGKDFVFALLMLDYALGCEDEVYVVVNLHIRGMPGCCARQLAGVECWEWWAGGSLWTLGVSILSFVSVMPNLPTVLAQCWYLLGPTLALQSLWTTSISFLEVFAEESRQAEKKKKVCWSLELNL